MSVLIKGMKMPENCDVCRFADWSNLHQTASCKLKDYQPCFSDYSREFKTQRSTICPLVDLGKHGRLIDADALDYRLGASDRDIYVMYTVEEEPTVIEAEGTDEGSN
jgi:hypothetical protein